MSVATPADDEGERTGLSRSQTRRMRQRTAARRHSGRVAFLRRLVPVIGVVLFLGVAGWITFERVLGGLPLGLAGLALTGDGFVMDSPTLSGSDASGRTYTVSAARAVQSIVNPGDVRLEDIVAKVELEDGTEATFTATAGEYNIRTEQLRLFDGLFIETSNGDTAELNEIEVDLKTGVARADEPVGLNSDVGTIRADRLRIKESGQTVRFEGNVRMTIRPDRVEMLRE